MGSRGNPNSWAPYGTYKDCSAGICSIYCPQWCYIIFPPPPPFIPDDNSGTNFSPLIIAVIGILASAFLLIAYYTVVSKYCRRRGGDDGGGDQPDHPVPELEPNRSHMHHDQSAASGGLDQVLIESIAVCQYKRGDGLVEGTECAVCLSEFEDNEKIRLLPKCSHAFHLPCIDTWLKSHSNCPLCRASVVSGNHHPLPPPPPPPPPATLEESSTLDITSLRVQTRSDMVLIVENPEWGQRTEVVVEDGVQEGFDKFKTSISLGSTPCRGNLLVSDILQICEDDEEREKEIHQEIGSSRGIRRENSLPNGGNEGFDLVTRSPVARHEKGKSSGIPN